MIVLGYAHLAPPDWQGFLTLAARTEVRDDFMSDRQDIPSPERDLF